MIQPEDIRRQAENLYRDFLASFVSGESFFPRVIRGRKMPLSDDLAEAIQAARRLREGSKEVRGTGYSVQWREVNSRRFGRNQFPTRILFESQNDYLEFIGKQREFASFRRAIELLRSEIPQLEDWLTTHAAEVLEIESDLPGLCHVVQYFQQHPRPNQFARELPIPVDTKFIGRYKRLLREWFDLALPPHTIRADEEHFERRYGLRYVEPYLNVRFLDPLLQQELGFPCAELALPLSSLAGLNVEQSSVIIVENKVNLFTLPSMYRVIALGGLGDGVRLLRDVPWLMGVPITYWGDLDIAGFQILSALRGIFQHVQSRLMDRPTLDRWRKLADTVNCSQVEVPLFLTEAEQAAFLICRDENIRLEQERVPHMELVAEFAEEGARE